MKLLSLFILFYLFAIVKFVIFYVLPYFIFWKWFPDHFKKFKIQSPERQKPQIEIEIKYSMVTLLIFAMFGVSVYYGVQANIFKLYLGFASKGLGQEVIAFFTYFFIYDIYFFASHRFLHIGWFYKNVHRVHHRSINPTPFAAYSFHPIEAVINLLYFYPVLYFFPMSIELFIFLLFLTDLSNLGGHLGYDLISRHARKYWLGKHLTTPTHHNLHHQLSKSNYGLYWNGWDNLFKTTHPRMEIEIERVNSQL